MNIWDELWKETVYSQVFSLTWVCSISICFVLPYFLSLWFSSQPSLIHWHLTKQLCVILMLWTLNSVTHILFPKQSHYIPIFRWSKAKILSYMQLTNSFIAELRTSRNLSVYLIHSFYRWRNYNSKNIVTYNNTLDGLLIQIENQVSRSYYHPHVP